MTIGTPSGPGAVWDGTTDTAWYDDHSNQNSFTIYTAKELAGLAQLVNSKTETFNGKTVILGADIKLNDTTNWKNWGVDTTPTNKWTPIGTGNDPYDPSDQFCGIFDGAGHSISGLYSNDAASACVGLFGSLYGATVKDLMVSESYLYGSDSVGGIVGHNFYGTVENCQNAATVSGGSNASVGGVVGYNDRGDSNVTTCQNFGVVKGEQYGNIGGVVGYNWGTVSECTSPKALVAGATTEIGYEDNSGTYRGCVIGQDKSNTTWSDVSMGYRDTFTDGGYSISIDPKDAIVAPGGTQKLSTTGTKAGDTVR